MYPLIGCDIVKIARVKELLKRKTVYEKIFHPSELMRFDAHHLAGIFAAKEAVFKALGIETDQWLAIEIRSMENGKPTLHFSKNTDTSGIISWDLSISHEEEYAVAVLVCLMEKQ